KSGTVTDPFSRFCDSGVLGQNAVTWMLTEQLKPEVAAAGLGPAQLADYVQITNDLPNSVDPYWTQGIQRPGTTGAPPAICGDPTDPTTCECRVRACNKDNDCPGSTCASGFCKSDTDACACGNNADPSTCFCKTPGSCSPVTCDYSTCET